ncbi:MAG: hypothetical protein H7245_17560 [Candidatus Saccharibacteria bacterium]|nr:hypothetical protein [Pseudorhodobacter sp.]
MAARKSQSIQSVGTNVIFLDASDFAHSTTNLANLALVGSNMFGGILVNAFDGQATSFATSVDYLNLSNIRFPGGELSENGSVRINSSGGLTAGSIGGEQSTWLNGDMGTWNYAYDLRYPDLMNPDLLADPSDMMSFSDAILLANANGASVELVLPTVRYTDATNVLTDAQATALLVRCQGDVTNFLRNLYVTQTFGTPPVEAILDIGNENLVWTRAFDGQVLAAGQKYDAAAVKWGIGLYFDVAKVMLDAAADFRAAQPDTNFKMGIQVPYMNNQPGADDPFDVFLAALKAMPSSQLAQIDLLRFHPLQLSFNYAADLENWLSDDMRAYAAVINAARAVEGVAGDVQLAADAHTANGNDDGGAGNGLTVQSLKAAAATVAQFASMVEMGVTLASAWGVAINYMEDVQASYYDTDTTHYTPRGEVLRQMSETLAGMTLINSAAFMDADRSGPVNVQSFGDSSKYVLFVSANDINDGDSNDDDSSGHDVTIDLGNLAHGIAYAWIETITCATGSSGEAVIWNPQLDATGSEKGETWLTFTDSTISFHLGSDYQMVRVVVSTGGYGSAAVALVGDARLGFGIVDDVLTGGSGDDTMQGLSGNDTIWGGAGNDLVAGGGGNDTLWGELGADSIYGGTGDDVVYYDGNSDIVDGGEGYDTLIMVTKLRGAMTIGTGFEYVVGSEGNDNFVGNSLANRINAKGGDDYIAGWGGNDLLEVMAGNDTVYAGDGDDSLTGGTGLDALFGGAGNDTVLGGSGLDQMAGGLGNDVFRFDTLASLGDAIADFSKTGGNSDRIFLNASALGLNLAKGRLADQNFRVTTNDLVHDADDYFIFRTSDRTLWLDSNGAAADGLMLVADLQDQSPVLLATDIVMY